VFVGACLPMADVRPFVDDETGHLTRPTWPNIGLPTRPEIAREREFVRGCGSAERRRGGGPDTWPGEHAYVRSEHLVRFVGVLGDAASDPLLHGAQCTFRRLFCSPPARARVELGVRVPDSVAGAQLPQVLAAVGNIPLRVGPRNTVGTADAASVPLVAAGTQLAARFLRATTRRKFTGDTPDWWVGSLAPLLVVETSDPDAVEHLRSVGAVQRPDAPEGTTLLHAFDETTGAHVWLVAHDGLVTSDPALRHLRIHLVRLHEERETLKFVLRRLALEQIQIVGGSDASDRLDQYLLDAAKRFEQSSFHGIGVEGTLRVAYGAEALVADGDWATLRDALQQTRRQVARAVERVARADEQRVSDRPSVNIWGDVTMNQGGDVNIGQGATGPINLTGVQIATGQQIDQSLSDVQTSGASDEVKSVLTDIHTELQKLLPELNEDQAKKAADSYEVLAKAPADPKPDRKWYEVSASGLLEAAQAVAKAGEPLVGLIRKLFTIV